jgi:hypothetical protein
LGGTVFSEYIHIAHMTLDGNRTNVSQPSAEASDDLSHNGIFTQASRYSVFEDLEVKNFWFQGIGMGLYAQYNQLVNIYTSTNGYSNTVGYSGIQIGGSSWHNTVTNHISVGDIEGIKIYDNARYNSISGTYRNNYHGVVLSDQGGNTSNGNVVIATIYNSTSQGFTVGGSGTHRDSKFNVAVDTTSGDAGVYIGANVTACTFDLTVRNAADNGVEMHGSYNTINLLAHNNSQSSPTAHYGIKCIGAVGNQITGVIVDDQGSVTQRAISLDADSDENTVIIRRHGSSASVSDSGTANIVIAPLDANDVTVSNLNTSPILYNSSGALKNNAHIVIGSATIGGGGTISVTLSGSAAFSGVGNYIVVGQNETGARPFAIAKVSGSQFTITGTASDAITFTATGF